MKIKAAEISSVIKDQISNFDAKADVAEVGTVLSVAMESRVFMVWIRSKLEKWLNFLAA